LESYPNQLKVLAGTRRITKQEIEDYISRWYSTGASKLGEDDDAPWSTDSGFNAENVNGTVHIVLSDRIYIDSSEMTNSAKRQLRRMAVVSNKQYYRNLAMDVPNYDVSRFIYLGEDKGKYIILPRGLREELMKRFDKAGISYAIEDKRVSGHRIKVSFGTYGKIQKSWF
jgi:hypothetical protein